MRGAWPLRRSAFGAAALARIAGLITAPVLALLGTACTSLPGAGDERIGEVAGGRHITRAELLAAARASDYGVAQLAARLQPHTLLLSVAFVEHGATSTEATYTYLWVTAAAPRDDLSARPRPPSGVVAESITARAVLKDQLTLGSAHAHHLKWATLGSQ